MFYLVFILKSNKLIEIDFLDVWKRIILTIVYSVFIYCNSFVFFIIYKSLKGLYISGRKSVCEYMYIINVESLLGCIGIYKIII